MSDDPSNISCAEFQAQLPQRIGAGEDVAQHPHVQGCELCRTLLAELETIAEAARQLYANSDDPPDEVWDNIESALKQEKTGLEGANLATEPS